MAKPASPGEVRAALGVLSPAHRRRLARPLGRHREGRSPDDLLSEATLQILSCERAWKRANCSFVQLIARAMQSTAHHWKEKAKGTAWPDPEAGTSHPDAQAGLDGIPGSAPEPWRSMADAEERLAVELWFGRLAEVIEEDEIASRILRGLREGLSHAALSRMVGAHDFKFAMRRIFRRARGMGPPPGIPNLFSEIPWSYPSETRHR